MLTLSLLVTNEQARAVADLLRASGEAAAEALLAAGPDVDPEEESRLTCALAVAQELRGQCTRHLAACEDKTAREAAALRPQLRQDIIQRGRAILLARRQQKGGAR